MGKLTIQTMGRSGGLPERGVLRALADFNAYYFSGVLFLIGAAVVVGVSLATPPPSEEKVRGLTYGSMTPAQRAESRASWGVREVSGTVTVLGLVLALYVYFSFWLT
jgi:SSS family solute:Na+ symporter